MAETGPAAQAVPLVNKLTSKPDTRRLVVEGGVVQVERTTVEKVVSISDFVAKLSKTRSISVGPLPHNCVHYCANSADDSSEGMASSAFVVQLPPHMRKVVFRRPPANAEEDRDPSLCLENYLLSWPYTLWTFVFRGAGMHEIYLCAAKESFRDRGLDLPVFRLPIHNQYGEGDRNFCFGNLSLPLDLPDYVRVDEAMRHLLTSAWNTELLPNFQDTGLKSLADWHMLSVDKPEFWKEIRFQNHRSRNVRNLLNGLGFQL